MKKKILIMAMIAAMSVTALAGCGSDADKPPNSESPTGD